MKNIFSKFSTKDGDERSFLNNSLNRDRIISFSNRLKGSHDVEILKDYSVENTVEREEGLNLRVTSVNIT
jgi:hypothetical protein